MHDVLPAALPLRGVSADHLRLAIHAARQLGSPWVVIPADLPVGDDGGCGLAGHLWDRWQPQRHGDLAHHGDGQASGQHLKLRGDQKISFFYI